MIANMIILPDYFRFIKEIWPTFTWAEHGNFMYSFIICCYTSYNFLFISISTMFFHLGRGNTLIEVKYIAK